MAKKTKASQALYTKLKINLLHQNDSSLYEPIQKYGCRFMCLLAIPQIVSGRALTVDQVKEIYNAAVDGKLGNNVMESDCTCQTNESAMITMAFKMLLGDNTDMRARQMWVSDQMKHHKNPNELASKENVIFFIVDFLTASDKRTYGGHHFVLYSPIGELMYDPQKGGIKKYTGINRFLVYRAWNSSETKQTVETTTERT